MACCEIGRKQARDGDCGTLRLAADSARRKDRELLDEIMMEGVTVPARHLSLISIFCLRRTDRDDDYDWFCHCD